MKSTTPASTSTDDKRAAAFVRLCQTMDKLRSEQGCPWDKEQTLATLRSYLLEETHEVLDVLDAIADADDESRAKLDSQHCKELGDLMLQIVFQSQIQAEREAFDVADVCEAIDAKLVRRHPQIFGGATPTNTTDGSKERWEAIKRQEREAAGEGHTSALDGVPTHLPALLRAYRTGEKARGVGFDWPDHHGVVDKMKEELAEIEDALPSGDKAAIASEIGDLLYATVNLARHHAIDPEAALRGTMHRFEARFRIVEATLRARGKTPEQCSLDELEAAWQAAKRSLAG